jgi:hypothetical protein
VEEGIKAKARSRKKARMRKGTEISRRNNLRVIPK